MEVIIPALKHDCPASLALRQEGIKPIVYILDREDVLAYSDLMVKIWKFKVGFIIVEHDVVPWPGALRELNNCPNEWCTFPYPKFGEMINGEGMGCVKFATTLVNRFPHLWENWIYTPWELLDGRMLSSIAGVLSGPQPCIHNPPVAHARLNDR